MQEIIVLCQLLSGIIGFWVREVHWSVLKRCLTNISCPNSPFEGYPYRVNLGDGGQRSILHNLMVYKVDYCFSRVPD